MKPLPFFLGSFSILLTAYADPPKKSGDLPPAALSLTAVVDSVLADNPAIKEARTKWDAMKQRVPQAATWEHLEISAGTEALVGTGRHVFPAPSETSTRRSK